MAFAIDVEHSGITIEQAYAKIDDVRGNKEWIEVDLLFFGNKQASDEKKIPFKKLVFGFIPSVSDDAPNYHKQGYEHIKTLPEFSGAVDVLEEGQSA